MKQKCSSILKIAVALVLALLMVFGSVSTVLAAVVQPALLGAASSVAGTAANADLAGTGATTIYFKNTLGWSSVYAYRPEGWNSNGCYNTGTGTQMAKVSGTKDLYSCSVNNTDRIAFTNAKMDNYGNFYGNSAAYSTSFNSKYPVYYPGTTYKTVNTTKYYNEDNSAFWIAYDVKLYGDSSFASGWNTSSTASMSIDATTGYYKYTFTPTSARTEWFRILFGGSEKYCPNSGSDTTIGGENNKQVYKYGESGAFKFSSDTSHKYTIWMDLVEKKVWYTSETVSTNYTGITAVAKGTTDGTSYSVDLGSIQASTTVSSSTGLAVSAPAKDGYTFSKWVASGSGTFNSATSASTTFHPAANSEIATAQYKKNYTFSNGTTDTHGTVTVPSGTVLAGASYTGTVTPADGYKIKSLTVGGNTVTAAAGKTSAYTYSDTTGSSATGTSTPISVVATFEPITNLQLYIAGRFRVRPSAGSSSWTTTYASSSDWNATSTNIPFTYVSGTTYKVDTYASLKELSAKPTNNQDPWFFVYDKTNSKAWHPTTQNRELGTTTEYNLTTNTDTYNVRFNSSSDDSPVTIYFDYNTKRLWYTIPDLYDVTVVTATGGTVTASPARAEADTEITLTIAPTTGYQLKSITAKDSSNASVTLSGTGNTRTFTMPAKDVTVTPVFEKITWSGLTAVGKYSTTAANDASYSNDFPTGDAPTITIAATSATQLDGVAVSAPANDPEGYVFAGWYTAKGSFANAANKDTTFKPNAANAVAIAKYKKIFKITSSVDNTGTGAGTVTIAVTSGDINSATDKVLAGGTYTITATAKSGSAIESVKVNGTAKTATASQTISSVSADQTVVVKFKSNVYLRGGSTIGTNWTTGDAMTSNAAGTEFTKTYENVAGSSSGTQYQFKLYVNGYNNDGTATINITGGTSTGTCTHQSSGDQNYVLTLKKAANVTVKSNGTKITEIKVVPANSQKYAVTFKKAANTTITGQYEGTNFTTASADATVQVYEGDEISFTVTAASGYHISDLTSGTTPTFSPAVTKTYKLSNVTAAKEITPTAAADVNITAVTNKKARGTVSVDKNKSFKGDTVKITVTPLAGTLKTLTATYGSGDVYTYKDGNWNAPAGTGAAIPNKFLAVATGALANIASLGEAQTINMVMQEDSNVTINATFDTYSAESTWYYNGYQSATDPKSAYWGKQMTESMLSGEKFSYYHVTGRGSENYDQYFTVSNGKIDTGTRYVYFTNLKSGGWDYSHAPYAHFDGKTTWPGIQMDWYTDNDMGQPVYRAVIPAGATQVQFHDNNQHQSTVSTDLASGGYYVDESSSWDSTYQKNNHTIHSYSCSYPSAGVSGSGTEYKWGSGVYKDNFYTGGFYDQGSNVAKPKDNNGTNFSNCKDDYYIVVLYPGKTYTLNYNGQETTNTVDSDKPWVIWLSELPSEDETVTVYAKDGAIRAETFGSTYANIADTKIYDANGTSTVGTKHNGSIANQTYETYKGAKGETIVIKTAIGATDSSTLDNATALKNKYYVRGFCVNGEVSQLLDPNDNGVYTLTYKIPEDFEGKYIEITPIYYLKDTEANPIVTYRVTGFTDELKAVGTGKPGWGDTLYTYPFYGKLGGQNNAFGAYPGQPMVYYKGQYQMQIPQKSTAWDPYEATAATVNNTNVAGITMSNGYWDSVHKLTQGYGDNSASADHVQTYDYGDFYKIFNEKKPVDNIVFDFKYRTTTHNFEATVPASPTPENLNSTYKNGFELLTNFHGKHVDLFGTPLSGAAADPEQTTPVYVVSIGGVKTNAGVENIAGYYATEWMVFGSSNGSSYSRISAGGKNSIPPEVLVLNDDDDTSFNTTTYPSAVDTTAKPYKITDWKALYTALEAYRGKPVYISYEAADAQQGQEMYYTGTGGATRNDGRWLYSKNGENITSNIKIQYSDDNGVSYTDLNTTTPQVTGLSAYFTNTEAYEQMTYATTIDPDKTFDFEAKTTNADYKFVGWYMSDGTKITSDNASHTERSGSYTFVAKFMKVESGQLILSHSVDKGTINNVNYQGAGDVTIAVDVIDPDNGDTIVKSFPATASDITLDDKIIKSDSNYKIKVTLTSTPQNNNALGTTVLAQPSGQNKFFSGASDYTTNTDESTKTRTDSFTFTVKDLFTNTTQNVKSIIYHSYFLQYVFNYNINFEYYDRFDTVNGNTHTGTKKVYNVKGTLTNAEAAEYVYKDTVIKQGVEEIHRFLKKEFVQTIAPYESNFNEKLTWNFNSELDFGNEASGSNYVYNVTGHYVAIQEDIDTRTAIFALPYEHDANGAATSDAVDGATTTNLVLNNLKYETVIKAANGDYITAPTQVGNKYFRYWSINTTKTVNNTQVKGNEVARCYFKSFNFMAYDNYYIEPVYDTEKYDYKQSGSFTNITYLDTTRNQWNTDGEDHYTMNGTKKTASATDRAAAADLLYNDFMLNYNYNGKDIYLAGDDVDDITDLGYIVERVQLLDENQDGTRDTTMSKYADKGMTADQAKAIATSYNTNKGTQNKITKYTGDDPRIARYSVDKIALDNKNRIEIYDAYYNAAGWDRNDKDFVVNYAYKNYVYKVYTYMVVNGETIVSDNPAYFTMYNEALKTADKMIAN